MGERKPHYTLLDADNPITVGPLDLQDFYFEHRRRQAEAMFNADKVVQEVADEFAKLSGRQYEFFEAYQLDDAEMAIVVIGSTAGTAKYVVNELRAKGVKAGLLKMRMFRPFPAARLREALANIPAVAVMDRADSLAACGGPLFGDLGQPSIAPASVL